jgi:uncharacterized zinc-type alcohol dehydrogenase-like protein
MMIQTKGYATHGAKEPFKPFAFTRRNPTPNDVQIDILYCGICHSDIHTARNEWGGTTKYPCVPGHEIVGRVVAIGRDVKKFKEGDLAAVGCMVDSCGHCDSCKADLEQFCENGATFTYNSEDKHTGGYTFGGYSKTIVVDERFVLHFPKNLDPAAGAPLQCAGITTYSPLRKWNVKKGQRVGVVGLGGLGHMALKFAHAFGADVTLFTTSPDKTKDAKRLGANHVVISRDKDAMEKQQQKFDFIIDTVSAKHDLNEYLALLKRDGALVMVGASPEPLPVNVFNLIMPRRQLAGSLIGGIAETQEMLDFCSEHDITCDIEMIPANKIDEAYERMLKSDVKYRFVIDVATI